MSNAKMTINKERWKGFDEEERSWILFDTLQDINARVRKLENRKIWDGAKSFAGGMIGGAAAAIGMIWGGIK